MRSYGCTNVGLVRANNEDSFYIDDERGIYLVTDGMGGVDGGEVASRLIVDQLPMMIHDLLTKSSDLSATPAQVSLQESIHAVNNLIYREGMERKLIGMGATLTLAVIDGKKIYIFQIGDSRAYLIRNQSIEQLTKDQTVLEDGQEVLTHAMGMEEHLQAELTVHEIKTDDYFLLCSDGIYGMIADEEILNAFDQKSAEDICTSLILKANQAGGEDNSTAIVICA